MSRFFAALLTVAITAASVADAAPARVLTLDGLGPVRIGMTLRAAARALGTKLTTQDPDVNADCNTAMRAGRRDADVWYMLAYGRVTRIDVDPDNPRREPAIATETGIHVGSREADIRRAYGRRVRVEPDPYMAPEGHYVRVYPRGGHSLGFIFQTLNGVVTAFRVGVEPSLGYSEGCS